MFSDAEAGLGSMASLERCFWEAGLGPDFPAANLASGEVGNALCLWNSFVQLNKRWGAVCWIECTWKGFCLVSLEVECRLHLQMLFDSGILKERPCATFHGSRGAPQGVVLWVTY